GSFSVWTPFAVPRPYRDMSASASITRVHRWFGLPGWSSYGSSTEGKLPPAVYGPFDAENSVETIAPPGHRRTTDAVSAIARSVLACSRWTELAVVALTRTADPPYTWHADVSHVEA